MLSDVYRMIAAPKKLEFAREAAAFALAKGMERTLLSLIRPDQKLSFWLVAMEIQEGPMFNLPAHLEDKLFDYMDACENAVEEYTESNLNFAIKDLFDKVQIIGAQLTNEDNLKDITVGGLSNDKIMTRDEIHNFCIQGGLKALEQRDYEIKQVFGGSANPINIIAQKNGITYNIAVTSAILPKTGSLEGWRLRECEKQNKNGAKPSILGVSILPSDELYASMGIAVKEGEYSFRVSPVEVITPRK